MKLLCDVFKRTGLIWRIVGSVFGVLLLLSWRTCVLVVTSFFPFLDMVELDGVQRAGSQGLMVHQGMGYRLHIFFSESAVSRVGGGLARVGVVVAVGFPQLWVSRLGRGVCLILLAPLCNTQTQAAFSSLPDQPPSSFKNSHSGDHRPDCDGAASSRSALTRPFPPHICVAEPVEGTRHCTHAHRHNVPCELSASVSLSPIPEVHTQWRNGGMLVDQCLSEAVICLAPVLLWAGRWDGYPYPPSGQPGMDEMRPWPSPERDQGITVLCTIPAAQLFLRTCQIMRVRPCDQH